MRKRVEGILEVQAVVLPDGTVGYTRVSIGPAQAAARMWRFRPGTKGGRPVPVLVTIEMSFGLGKE